MTDSQDLFANGEAADDNAEISVYAKNAYLAYAVSVVKGRALPYVADGQKPVQRRILYAMKEMGLTAGAKAVKSARVVGEVLGKFHPHGDSSAYEAAVRMAQDFSLRYPLIDGQGNFGSPDGDSAAAMRYTEMRLSPIADLLLSEIDRGTIDFQDNYDGVFKEPTLLPARLPMMLLNGAYGIAVGMGTRMVPHNLTEVAQATLHLMEHPSATTADLLLHMPGPDFPGGGQLISSPADIHAVYDTGRGSLRLRARWEIEQMARGQWRMIVTELPDGVSVETVLAEVAAIANPKPRKDKSGKEKKTLDQDQLLLKQSLLNLLDSTKNAGDENIRLVFEPKTSKVPVDELTAFLLAHTSMEESCPVNMVMIGLNGLPEQKNLVTILQEWIAFRKETVHRRCAFDLDKIERRIHILEGRMIALLSIDEIIHVIRNSDDPKVDLMTRFSLTEIQAEDILEIRLRQLARLEGIKIEKELKDLREEAGSLSAILGSEARLATLVRKEIQKNAEKYGDPRRTLIEPVERAVASVKSFVVDEPVTILLSKNGWIRSQKGHGIDRETLQWKVGDNEMAVLETRTTLPIVLLDSSGRAYSIDAATIPGGKSEGVPLSSLIEIQNGGKIIHALTGTAEDKYLFAGVNGYGFIAPLGSLVARPRAGKAFMKVEPGEVILPPVKLEGQTHIRALTEARLLVFPLEEMKELPAGGKGVIIMDVGDLPLARLELGDGASITVTGKRGKDRVIQGDEMSKYLLHRARKGCAI